MMPTKEELLARYKVACDLKQPVKPEVIERALGDWIARISKDKLTVRFVKNDADAKKAVRDAWAAWAAWAARAARAAWAAWAARAARAAWDARDARDAWPAW